MIKRIMYFLVLSLSLLFILCSIGQAKEKIGIFKIALDEGANESARNQSFGRPISLRLKKLPINNVDLHARIFRGTIELQKQIEPDAQDCVKFFTAVLEVRVTDTVDMKGIDDPAWLKPDEDGFKPEQYTIVFETGDQSKDPCIRIKYREIDNYFKYAIVINLVPPEDLKHAVRETVEAAKDKLRESVKTFQSINDSTCWNVKLIADGLPVDPSEIVKVAELTPCIVEQGPFFEEGALVLANNKEETVQATSKSSTR
jgi:hypothetical protein